MPAQARTTRDVTCPKPEPEPFPPKVLDLQSCPCMCAHRWAWFDGRSQLHQRRRRPPWQPQQARCSDCQRDGVCCFSHCTDRLVGRAVALRRCFSCVSRLGVRLYSAPCWGRRHPVDEVQDGGLQLRPKAPQPRRHAVEVRQSELRLQPHRILHAVRQGRQSMRTGRRLLCYPRHQAAEAVGCRSHLGQPPEPSKAESE
jgi:hypothetical protein